MNKLFILMFGVFSLSLSAVNAEEQENKLSSISLSSGNGPLTAGIVAEANFTRGSDIFNITLGERDLYVYYLKSLITDKLCVGPSLEYFYNVPVVGLMMSGSPTSYIATFTWAGCSAGEPGSKIELLKWKFLFFYQSLDLSYWRLTAGGAIMYCAGWQPIASLKYTQPVIKNISIFTFVGYNFFEKGTALLRFGATYKL
jgi:hypothetical protein